jgi:hypothetical protein
VLPVNDSRLAFEAVYVYVYVYIHFHVDDHDDDDDVLFFS